MPETKRTSRRKFLKRAIAAGTVGAAINAFAIEPNWIQFRKIEIPIDDLPDAFDGYRIGLISDIHYPNWASRGLIHRACGMLNEFKPDVVAIPGDFSGQIRGVTESPDFTGLFDSIQSTDGIVGTLGNHDHWIDVNHVKRNLASQTPIKLIDHKHVLISRGSGTIAIGGVGDLWEDSSTAEEAFQGVSETTPRILLSHNPDFAEVSMEQTRVDLVLSGHTHGGQLRIPFYGAPKTPSEFGRKFEQGLVQGKRYRVYVTRGICSIAWIRFLCRPEVTGITLRQATRSIS